MKMIMKCVYGSHLYGNSTPSSDKDFKGILLPSHKDCYLNRIPKSIPLSSGDSKTKNTKDDIDNETYSLQHFIELACKGETVSIDMLHCNDECLIKTSDIWKEIVKNRKRFYTNDLSAFIGYARKQASLNSVRSDRLNTCEQIINFLKSQNKENKLRDIWDKLPLIEHVHFVDDSKNEDIKYYQIVGKKFQSTVKVGYVLPILEKFSSEYGERVRLVKENKGLDFKAISHAVRAALQVKEILSTNDLIFPLKDADLLRKIKLGEMNYVNEISPIFEDLMAEVEELSIKSTFPSKVDRKFWEEFIVDVYSRRI